MLTSWLMTNGKDPTKGGVLYSSETIREIIGTHFFTLSRLWARQTPTAPGLLMGGNAHTDMYIRDANIYTHQRVWKNGFQREFNSSLAFKLLLKSRVRHRYVLFAFSQRVKSCGEIGDRLSLVVNWPKQVWRQRSPNIIMFKHLTWLCRRFVLYGQNTSDDVIMTVVSPPANISIT